MNRKYDRYLNPDKMADEEYGSPEEISSHSSLLTNRRLDIMFARLDEVRVEAWTNTCIPTIKEFYAVLSGIHNNIFPLIKVEDNEKIIIGFNQFDTLYRRIFTDDGTDKHLILDMILQILDQLQRIMINSLQELQFFFRLQRKQMRGMKEVLEMYAHKRRLKEEKEKKKLGKEAGEMFKEEGEDGGVPKLDEPEHKPVAENQDTIQ